MKMKKNAKHIKSLSEAGRYTREKHNNLMHIFKSIEEAVEKSSVFLDENYPNWHEVINTETLDISSNNYCIMSQILRMKKENDLPFFVYKNIPEDLHHAFGLKINATKTKSLWIRQIKKRNQKPVITPFCEGVSV